METNLGEDDGCIGGVLGAKHFGLDFCEVILLLVDHILIVQ